MSGERVVDSRARAVHNARAIEPGREMLIEPKTDGTGNAAAKSFGAAGVSPLPRRRGSAETTTAMQQAGGSPARRRTTAEGAAPACAGNIAARPHATAVWPTGAGGDSRKAGRAPDTSAPSMFPIGNERRNGEAAEPLSTFQVLQEWEGYVVDVGVSEFTARLIDLTAGESHEREEAAIPLAAVSSDDADLAVPGGIFRWIIGNERSSAEPPRCASRIVFRHLGAVAQADIDNGKAWARKIARSFGRDCAGNA